MLLFKEKKNYHLKKKNPFYGSSQKGRTFAHKIGEGVCESMD
jgi:hypothetical protein